MVFSVRLWKKGRGSVLVSRSKTSARSEKDSFMMQTTLGRSSSNCASDARRASEAPSPSS